MLDFCSLLFLLPKGMLLASRQAPHPSPHAHTPFPLQLQLSSQCSAHKLSPKAHEHHVHRCELRFLSGVWRASILSAHPVRKSVLLPTVPHTQHPLQDNLRLRPRSRTPVHRTDTNVAIWTTLNVPYCFTHTVVMMDYRGGRVSG